MIKNIVSSKGLLVGTSFEEYNKNGLCAILMFKKPIGKIGIAEFDNGDTEFSTDSADFSISFETREDFNHFVETINDMKKLVNEQ